MSEKLCLQWHGFNDNVICAFPSLREEKDFADVTLACEDGKQVEVHKVILSSSSPFFRNLLRQNKHPHPLIYMRGLKSDDLIAIIDFLYCGEANVCQENLDSFLAIAEELQLKGLMGKSVDEDLKLPEVARKVNPVYKKEATSFFSGSPSYGDKQIISNELDIVDGIAAKTKHISGDLQDFARAKCDSIMEKTPRKMPNGKPLYSCKICGKEDESGNMKHHIEVHHMEGVSFPCNFCEKTFRSRQLLRMHNRNHHTTSV